MRDVSPTGGATFETLAIADATFNEILDEAGEDQSVYRDAAKTAWGFVRRGLAYINAFENKPLAWDCWLFVMEEYELLGCHEEKSLAKKHRCTRANVSKIVKDIERAFGMVSALRGDTSNMVGARKEQLK